MDNSNKFSKKERIKSTERISYIFYKGNPGFAHPYKFHYTVEDTESETQLKIAISVAKKKFKYAVDRNKIKRITKEAFRLNKSLFYNLLTKQCLVELYLVFIGKEIPSYSSISKSMATLLTKLGKEINAKP